MNRKADIEIKKKAYEASHAFVEELRRNNPPPKGEWKVSNSDYKKLEEHLAQKVMEIAEQ